MPPAIGASSGPGSRSPACGSKFDWGKGPQIAGRDTLLWCAWLAWSRFRVIIPTWDRTLPTVIACLDETLRRFGGAPTYALTDNERTVTIDRVAGIAVKHPILVAAARHYGLVIHACVPADPASKGGSESTVKIAKADLVPTEANLLEAYPTFTALRVACAAFCTEVNARPHRETRRPPDELIGEERRRLHPVPAEPYTVAFGLTRVVDEESTVRHGSRAIPSPTSSSASGSGSGSTATSSSSSTRARRERVRSPVTGSRRPATPGSIRPTIRSARATRSTRVRGPRAPKRRPSSSSGQAPSAG
jgi:hypothetical protein